MLATVVTALFNTPDVLTSAVFRLADIETRLAATVVRAVFSEPDALTRLVLSAPEMLTIA